MEKDEKGKRGSDEVRETVESGSEGHCRPGNRAWILRVRWGANGREIRSEEGRGLTYQ